MEHRNKQNRYHSEENQDGERIKEKAKRRKEIRRNTDVK
jgi:hypothetical protein